MTPARKPITIRLEPLDLTLAQVPVERRYVGILATGRRLRIAAQEGKRWGLLTLAGVLGWAVVIGACIAGWVVVNKLEGLVR